MGVCGQVRKRRVCSCDRCGHVLCSTFTEAKLPLLQKIHWYRLYCLNYINVQCTRKHIRLSILNDAEYLRAFMFLGPTYCVMLVAALLVGSLANKNIFNADDWKAFTKCRSSSRLARRKLATLCTIISIVRRLIIIRDLHECKIGDVKNENT